MATLIKDIRHALRSFARTPLFTLVVVLTLALGLGATTAIFSVVKAVILDPLPYPEPARIVSIFGSDAEQERGVMAPGNFLDLARESRTLVAAAAFREDAFVLWRSGREAERLLGVEVTPRYFEVLGMRPRLGQTPVAKPDLARQAVLSDAAFRRFFGGDPSIVGQATRISGEDVTIVGVMPDGFAWRGRPDLWIVAKGEVPRSPVAVEGDIRQQRGLRYLEAVGRLAPNATLASARAEVAALGARLERAFPENNSKRGFALYPLQEVARGSQKGSLVIFATAVGLVLLIAAANVSGMLLTRTAGRGREMAIRASLGASRGRLVRQLLTETTLLAFLGAAAGLVVADGGTRLILAFAPESLADLAQNARPGSAWVVLFAFSVATVVGTAVGLIPALQVIHGDLADPLRGGGRGSAARGLAGRLLVTLEVAVALVVLMGSGLLLTTLRNLERVEPGYSGDRLLTVELPIPATKYTTPEAQARFYSELVADLSSSAGIATVSAGFPRPFGDGTNSSTSLYREGAPVPRPGERPPVLIGIVMPGYFRTLGIPLISGRDVSETDRLGAPRVALISAEAARRFWPRENPVGTRMNLGWDDWVTVVGVVADTRRQGLEIPPEPTVFLSYRQFMLPFLHIAVKPKGDAGQAIADVRAAVRRLNPDLPIGEVASWDQILSTTLSVPRFRTLLLAGFAAVGLLLAALGLYGVVSQSVERRVREMGIRMALGARPRQVIGLVLREGMSLTALGLVVGIVVALLATRLLSSFLYGVGAGDPVTLGAVTALILAVALCANALPARRAARVDPAEALRAEG